MWPNPQETVDLVTFAEEILNGKLHFFCSYTFVILVGIYYTAQICIGINFGGFKL